LFYKLPLSEKHFIEILYFYYLRRLLKLNPPRTFNEKIQWLKLYGCNEQYTALADKYAVREYVRKKIGGQYLNELFGVYDDESEIDFDVLPQKFVLKANHGCGWNIFCRDKNKLDINAAKSQLGQWLRMNYFKPGRDPIYKNIPPKIVCECLLEDENRNDLVDYKFYCFHGHVQFVYVITRSIHIPTTANMFDKDWVLIPLISVYPNNPIPLERPEDFERMNKVAEVLANGIPLVRVDLYYVNSRIIFGELTFSDGDGYGIISPVEWDYKLGEYLHLPVAHV